MTGITEKLKKYAPLLFVAFVLSSCGAPETQMNGTSQSDDRKAAFETCGISETEYARLLALPQDKFDQDFTGGWRPYADIEGCKNTTAELIKDYILYSAPYPPRDIGMLRWHAGQMKAATGRYNEAINLFKGTYHRPDDNQDWNIYVDASIAFLEGDKVALQAAYDALAATDVPDHLKAARQKFLDENPNVTMPDGFINQPANLSVVKDLIDCFAQPYSKAYGRCGGKTE